MPAESNEVMRVERHIIMPNHSLFPLCDALCFKAKNVYNTANYICRQNFFAHKLVPKYVELWKFVSQESCMQDFNGIVQTAQQATKQVANEWKSYSAAIADYQKNPDKYKGKPKIPKYKHKVTGRAVCTFTNQQVKERDFVVSFPAVVAVNGEKLTLTTKLKGKLQQVRIIPGVGHYVIEVVKKVPVRRYKPDNGRYMSIDIGVDNTCAVITNDGGRPLIINGRGAKSVNQKYNKNIARYKSIWDKCNKTVLNEARKAAGLPCVMSSKRIDAITRNRNNRITDMFHKISRVIADKANRDGVCAIVIGKNTDWKQNSNLGRQNNQNFVHLPFAKLIDMITYKARNYGIRVITVDEKYTSGTSFLDGEDPVKENYNKKRRIHRGLFWTKNALINADVNAACQILKKAYPMAFDETALKRNIRARGRLGSTAGDSGRPVSFTYEAAKALLNPVKCDVDELLTAAGKPALANVISLAC